MESDWTTTPSACLVLGSLLSPSEKGSTATLSSVGKTGTRWGVFLLLCSLLLAGDITEGEFFAFKANSRTRSAAESAQSRLGEESSNALPSTRGSKAAVGEVGVEAAATLVGSSFCEGGDALLD
jgi:hypothetical protein